MTAPSFGSNHRPLRILWVVPYLPWPTTSGGKARQFQLLRALAARGHQITLLVQSKTAIDTEGEQVLSTVVEHLYVLPRRPLKNAKTLALALGGPLPLLASVNGYAPMLEATFTALLEQRWDVIQLEHSYSCQPYLSALLQRNIPFVLTEHNIESTLSAATYNKLPIWVRPLAWFDQARYRHWERRVMRAAGHVVAVTHADAELMAQITTAPVSVVVNGVDIPYFAEVCPDAEAKRILYIGNYEYAPNVDAVEWALREIMPAVWASCPEARICICGFRMPERWPRMFVDKRIEWRGFVRDLTEVQRQASVFLAPLRDGGGSKLKVLEALAASLPLVSTAEGISGLAVMHGRDALIGDDATTLARQLVTLLNAPEMARRMGLAGRECIAAHHAWSVVAEQLEQVYDSLPTLAGEQAA